LIVGDILNDLFHDLPDFIQKGSPDFLRHLIRLTGTNQQAFALVSSDLRTLDATPTATHILGGSFLSLFDILSEDACRMAKNCLENQSISQLTDTIDGLAYRLTFYPLGDQFLLLLTPISEETANLSDDFFYKYKIQNNLSNIYQACNLVSADKPETLTQYRQMIQRNVLQVIRSQNHSEILSPAFTDRQLRLQMEDVAKLIRQIGGQAQLALQKQNRQLHMTVPETLIASFDPKLLPVAIYNLLANSILYTKGDISLSLFQHGNQIQIRVSDEGDGIPDWVQAELQQASLQSSPTPASLAVGRGIALVRKIAQLHYGNLLANSSEKGFSMVFSFSQTLPEQGKFSQAISAYGVSNDPYSMEEVELFSLL
jgi:signal transduction histidine kinase